jgi:hypothetical protein
MTVRQGRTLLALCTLLAVAAWAPAATAQTEGRLCVQVTSALIGVHHALTLTFTGLTDGYAQVYGAGCYTIPGGPGADCVPVSGSLLVFENKVEIALKSTEVQRDFGKSILTVSNTHLWIEDTNAGTGTWAAESLTYIESGVQGLQQFDRGTLQVQSCETSWQ